MTELRDRSSTHKSKAHQKTRVIDEPSTTTRRRERERRRDQEPASGPDGTPDQDIVDLPIQATERKGCLLIPWTAAQRVKLARAVRGCMVTARVDLYMDRSPEV